MELDLTHKLLAKQVKKYLSSESLASEDVTKFLNAVNESYKNFDRDKELFEHSSFLNEKEYTEINQKLKDEAEHRRKSVEKLIEAIGSLEIPDNYQLPDFDANNLISLVGFLNKQIENQKGIELELRQSKELAEKATQAKSEFLSMISHEIRTPLNAIAGMTYLMQQEDGSPAMMENLKVLQFSTENLLALINDILDFSKIEAGKVELKEMPFDLRQLVSNIKNANQLKAHEKGNSIRLMIDDELEDTFIGDPVRIGQVLTNLVSNAVKFTSKGSIFIEIVVHSKKENSLVLDFSVTDTGIGIDEDKQELIFEKFTQAHSSIESQYGGTGLGLVITRKLLKLYNSDIKLESTPGKGSKFYFRLELKTSNTTQKNLQILSEQINESTLKGIRVLLVEDYPVNIKVALRFLNKWQLDVDVAENGLIAYEKFLKTKYDIILMDILMPEMDGYCATEKIREIDPEIPIIALTASATISNQDRAFEVGMTDYLTKPFNPKELFQKIAKYCSARLQQI
ncbi:Signal transduction histidine kinase [Pseudarcicella hirudinis]|uniref:histidine kinase n=1 Tax=Pseudarcicella hirudinis TaxID=1079859 RepID=A0A1I5WBI2_9BACT|nr:response regulator [Pseudarcicella hirudinis]SFQ17090.1 Signal transduction histidine kinase [Pseudarcicella hirudinis]